MENTTLKEQIDGLQKDVVQITEHVKELVNLKGITSEVREIADKLTEVQGELKEKKHQFDVGTKLDISKKDLDARMDELKIARALCTNKDGSVNQAAYDKIASMPVYAEATKALEAFVVDATTSTTANYAADFVVQGFSSTLHEEIWLSLQIGALFSRFNMPNPTYTFPFLPGRLIAKAGSEGGTVTKQKVKSDKIVFNAKKIMAIVEMTDEFEQDSIVPALNLLRKQLIDSFALGMETMCLNGDNSENAALLQGQAFAAEDCRALVKGIRADSMDALAANTKKEITSMTAENLRAMRVPMGKYGKAPSDLVYIMTMKDYLKCLNDTNFPNYQSLYTYGANAQILTGELGRVDNIPVIVTELLPTAGLATDAPDVLGGLTATGIFDSDGLHATGCLVLVNKNAYQWGDRADFSLKLWENPLYGSTNLVGSQRLDFQKVFSKTAPTCVVGYNLAA